jgi:hypothetical protein
MKPVRNKLSRIRYKVKSKIPRKIRHKTICRKCKKAVINSPDRCMVCMVEDAVNWGRAY